MHLKTQRGVQAVNLFTQTKKLSAVSNDNLFASDYKRKWIIGKSVSPNGRIGSSHGLKKLNRLTKTLQRMPDVQEFK